MKKASIASLLPAMILAFTSLANGMPVQPVKLNAQPAKPVTQPAKPLAKPVKPVAKPASAAKTAPAAHGAPAITNATGTPAIANAAGQNPENQTYTYDPDGRRDPFLSLVYVQKQAMLKKKKKLGIPLEDYDVSQFQLFAVVISRHRYAMVKLPDDKYYDLRVGMPAGVNGGHVTSISNNSVTIVESVPDFKGVKHENAVTLRLRKEEE